VLHQEAIDDYVAHGRFGFANAIINSHHQRSELKEERTATEAPNHFSTKFRIECCVVVRNSEENKCVMFKQTMFNWKIS